ncbi:NUDIX domain-containing protein [Streptacidiphilus sp. 4-A2]|nr:NUDIX domain-containing protein [Streptacidiphilus sp. 4-A2]
MGAVRLAPGQSDEPYWVTIGGGVEPTDVGVEAALHREVTEELGGTLHTPQLVHLITDELDGGTGVQHIFVARLKDMDLSRRTGSEFSKPERGSYDVIRLPFTTEALTGIDLMPPQLAEFISANVTALRSVSEW